MWYFVWENLVPLEIEDFWTFLKIHLFTEWYFFFDFWGEIFQYNFGDIHGMPPIVLAYFSNNYDGNKDISIKYPPWSKGGYLKIN